jgi:hypothetical protein
MPRSLMMAIVALIAWGVVGSAAEELFVLRDTLRPRDAERSVRKAVREVSKGTLALDRLAGIHHLRTIMGTGKNKSSRQSNTATIYARVSGSVPAPIPGQPAIKLDNDVLTFRCEQIEDLRWICTSESLHALVDPGSPILDYFFLER